MAEQHQVEGFEAYISKVEEVKKASPSATIVVMFSGGKDANTGKSWCPDCVVAEPVVAGVLASAVAAGAVYIYCNVGGRSAWKDKNALFRTDPRTLLKSIPTLLKIDDNLPNTRLVEAQCANKAMIEMFFED